MPSKPKSKPASSKGAKRFALTLTKAAAGDEHPEIGKVQKYLTRFGYLSSVVATGKLDKPTSEAVKTFQTVHGLKPTGNLNPKTIEAMEMPRCGSPDVATVSRIRGGESGEFVLRGCSYNKTAFTYQFINGTPDIAGTQEQNAIRNALNTFAAALCGVSFTEAAGNTDFEYAWRSGNHGDGSPFDGAGNTLAHAFYPPPCGGNHAGECHFDEAEGWSLNGAGSTFDLETVALHETGHLLGLDHSTVAGSVMFASYGGVRRALTQDDLDGIRRLYPMLCRLGDSGDQAGFVAEIAAARHNQHQIVTAVRTQAGTLKLIAWDVAAGGAISRTGDSADLAGAATSIAIARNTTGSRFVTACRAANGSLKLISWDVNAAGNTISRLGDSENAAGAATIIRIVAVSNNRFVTACRDGSGDLKLIGWRLEANGALTRLADSGNQAGGVSEIALTRLASNRVVASVRDDDGSLKLISWSVSDAAITRLNDSGNLAGAATMIRAALDQANHLVTAVRAANQSLKLITWNITGAGVITRLNDSGDLAGTTNGHDISLASRRIITGVRTADGPLKVIIWQTANNGSLSRVGDSAFLAGSASLITQCEELSGAPPIVTSVRTTTNSLKLIAWSEA
jgi:Matrixin/Putative peptidoglycan binding domain